MSNKLRIETLTDWLRKFNVVLISGQKTFDDLADLGDVWFEVFRNVGEKQFVRACRKYMNSARFFPTPADIREIIDQVQNQPPEVIPKERRLEDRPATPEQVKEILDRFRSRGIKNVDQGRLSAGEIRERHQELKRQAKGLMDGNHDRGTTHGSLSGLRYDD